MTDENVIVTVKPGLVRVAKGSNRWEEKLDGFYINDMKVNSDAIPTWVKYLMALEVSGEAVL